MTYDSRKVKFGLVIDRPQDALNQRVEFRQCVELFGQVSVLIVDALDALDHIGQKTLTYVRPDARTLHERLSCSAQVVENPSGHRVAAIGLAASAYFSVERGFGFAVTAKGRLAVISGEYAKPRLLRVAGCRHHGRCIPDGCRLASTPKSAAWAQDGIFRCAGEVRSVAGRPVATHDKGTIHKLPVSPAENEGRHD